MFFSSIALKKVNFYGNWIMWTFPCFEEKTVCCLIYSLVGEKKEFLCFSFKASTIFTDNNCSTLYQLEIHPNLTNWNTKLIASYNKYFISECLIF